MGGVAVIPGDLGDGHLVQRHRDGTYAVLGQHQAEQPLELVSGEPLLPQDLHKLVQHAAEDLPKLGRLLRLLHPAALRLAVHLLRQGRFQIQSLHEVIECFHIVPGGPALLYSRRQTAQGAAHPAAQLVHLLQPCLPQIVPGSTVAVRIFRPVRLLQPCLAPDLPFQDVVFQDVTFLRRQARQAGFQPAEHVLILIAVGNGGQHTGQQAQHRLFQNVAAAADVGRNTVPLEHRFNGAHVVPHVPGRHGDIPAAALPRRQQPPDVRGGLLHLRIDRGGLPEVHSTAAALIGDVLPEKVPFQIFKC